MKNKMKQIAALLLALLLSVTLAVPAFAAETEVVPTIYIRNADDLLELAQNCRLDTWSQDKIVVLAADISLEGVDFLPIPTFGGTFDGQGHTISGLELSDSITPSGLFGVVQETAMVKDLKVSGTVDPSGDATNVGGIAGENYGNLTGCSFSGEVTGITYTGGIVGSNYKTGTINSCNVSGSISGHKMTGGIAGYNLGSIISCENRAYVNTVSADTALNPADINLDFSMDLAKAGTMDTSSAATDTGGIAGYSDGVLRLCKNHSTVGYPHIGYNVGGIVGRSCGYVDSCENHAAVYGRKDVGGIVGQIEPDIVTVISQDYIETLSKQFKTLGGLVDAAGDNASGAGSNMQNYIQTIANYMASARGALESLSGGPEAIPGAAEQLSSAVQGMVNATSGLGSSLFAGANQMTDDMGAISGQIGSIANTLSLASEEAQEEAIVDSSDINLEEITEGKVCSSKNFGSIQADINTGGIVGIIGMEYEQDPEDDVSASLPGSQRKRYEMKAIAQNCVNMGTVTGKSHYAGGICGRMELGLITNCEGYGTISSENGNYVGGIAGMAGSTIRGCFTKCTLSGYSYVGGIVGSGVEEDIAGDTSTVAQCCSMVEVEDSEEFLGAISGGDAGYYFENYFVSDTLAGINRISYTGIAQPISYDEMMEQAVPDTFRQLTLSFVVDGETVKTVSFDYGASFSANVYPEIAKKDGYYAHWDIEELRNLRFDTVVTAEYIPYVTALTSESARSNGKTVIFVEGSFNDKDVLTAESVKASADVLPADAWDFITRCFAGTEVDIEVVEQWKVTIPQDGTDTHIVRYLPEGDSKKLNVYIREGLNWTVTETQQIGSYICFCVDGNDAEFAVVSVMGIWWIWCIAGVIVLLIGYMLFRAIYKPAKRKREALLRDNPELSEAVFSNHKKKRRRTLLIAALVLILITMAVAVFLLSGKKADVETVDLLKTLAQMQELTMDLSVDAEIGGNEMEFTAQIDKIMLEDHPVASIQQDERKFFYTEGTVFLENGKAYKLSDSFPNYLEILDMVIPLYQNVAITESSSIYTIMAEDERATAILEILMPSYANELAEINEITIDLLTAESAISEIHIHSDGVMNDASDFSVTAVLTVNPAGREKIGIPEAVKTEILDGSFEMLNALTDDLLLLATAWDELEGKNPISANLLLEASCGPLVISEDLAFYRWTEGDLQITSIQKSDYALYFTDTKICDKNGKTLPLADAPTAEAAKLLDIAYQTCMSADLTCSESNSEHTYTLSLDRAGIEEVAYAIAPEIAEMEVSFDSGSIQLVVLNNSIQSIKLFCNGTLPVVVTETAVSLRAELQFVEGTVEVSIPDTVYKTLKK